jgi:sterol desaturase/sphingolipid hydroxylase (fatty acid hydroxylase superfamily)
MHIEQGGTFPAITPWLRLPTRNGDLDWRNSLGWVDTAGHPLKSRWCPKRKRPRSRVRSVVDDRDQRRRRPRQRSVTHMPEAGADSLLVYGFTAMMAHLLMSLGQTLFHRYLGHGRLGGRFFRNHIQFHHVHYAGDHVVSSHYLDAGDNNMLFFLMPVAGIVSLSYFFLRFDLVVVQLAIMLLSFCGHYYIDNQYHVAGSWLGRFSWFRRKQQLHFIHHRHGDCNFAVIDFFWDRLLGTYRRVEAGGSPVTSVASP